MSMALPLPAQCPPGAAQGLLVSSLTLSLYVAAAKFLHVSYCHRVFFVLAIPLVLPPFQSRSQTQVVTGVGTAALKLSPRFSLCPCSDSMPLLLSCYLNRK